MKVKNRTHKIHFLAAFFAVIILALIGGTIAYYSDQTTFTNLFTTDADISEYVEEFKSPENWTPCMDTPKTAIATNRNDARRYVRMQFTDYWRIKNSTTPESDHSTTDLPLYWTDENGDHRYTIINLQNEEDWEYRADGWYYYNTPIGKDESTTSLLKSVTFNCEANLVGEIRYSEDGKSGESIPNEYADAQYHVYVHFQMSNEPYDEVPDKIVARIERTQRLYDSIMSAEAAAIANDTITLLVDTEETVTNSKTVTLDLNNHTVIGSLTNTTEGNIRIINGEINNPEGPAVTNDGILTIGIDDYKEDGTANIIRDNVRLIGTTAGLYQTNSTYQFYFYDGYLEGDLGLVGGYDGAPFYRNTYDGTIVYFFPFVDHVESADRSYQHVELKNADKAVSKTSVHGDIYYYNLQDNINTSAITGYKVYAVRNFDASYAINSTQDTDVTFDITGYEVNLGDNVNIDGKFTIEDSKVASDEAGLLTSSKTIQNNGELIVKDATLYALTSNTLIQNNNTLRLRNATLKADKGITLYAVGNEITTDLDETSYIISESSNPAIKNNSSSFVLNNGNIVGVYCTIQNNSNITINGGTVKGGSRTLCSNYGTNTINGGSVLAGINRTSEEALAIVAERSTTVINGGYIESIAPSGYVNAVRGGGGDISITGGHIKVVNNGWGDCFGIDGMSNTSIVKNGENEILIEVTGTGNASVSGVRSGNVTVENATITASSASNNVSGISGNSSFTIKDGAIITVHSTNGNAYGIGPDGGTRYPNSATVTGGTIAATADSTSNLGIGISVNYLSITGGNVHGNSYGILGHESATLGKNEDPLYNGVNTDDEGHVYSATPVIKGDVYGISGGNVYFYDGIIKGGTAYVNSNDIIKAIPDGTSRKIVDITDPETEQDCWLEYEEDYLQLPNGNTYNSLTRAFADVQDGETITVIRDASTPAILPTNTKDITIDLNGHIVSYTQTLKNTNILRITDTSTEKTGKLSNTNTNVITNNKTLIVSDATIHGYSCTISNTPGATFTLNSGTIEGENTNVCNYNGTVNINGGNVLAGTKQAVAEIVAIKNDGGNPVTNITDGYIESRGGYGYIKGVVNGYIYVTGGHIKAYNTGWGETRAFDSTTSSVTGTDSKRPLIEAVSTYVNGDGRNTAGFCSSNLTIENADIVVESKGNIALGGDGGSNYTIKPGTVITVHATNNSAFGLGNTDRGNVNMTGGTITAITDSSSYSGVGISIGSVTVTGGSVYGNTNGINGRSSVTLGKNEDPLYNGVNTDDEGHVYSATPVIKGDVYGISGGNVYFYDGIIKGGTAYVNSNDIIKAIPDGTSRKIVDITDPETEQDCWLEYEEDYLQLPNGNTYNSLTRAFADVQDGETITVIRDASTPAILPTNTKDITIDLNGHIVSYTQTLKNTGSMTITDSSAEHNGVLTNQDNTTLVNTGTMTISGGTISGHNVTINNSGTLTIMDGDIKGGNRTIRNESNSTVNVRGGNIYAGINRTAEGVEAINSSGTVNITGGYIESKAGWGYIKGIHGGTVNMTGGHVKAINEGWGESYGISASSPLTITGTDEIRPLVEAISTYVNGDGRSIIGIIDCTVTIENATINVESKGNRAAGMAGSTGYTIKPGTIITVHSTGHNAYGIGEQGGRYTNSVNMTGGTITAISDSSSNVGVGINVNYLSITGGSVYGNTYGIKGAESVTIGKNETPLYNGISTDDEGHIYPATPEIRGGVYGVSSGNVYFYDGILKGATAPYYDRNIKTIADNTYVHFGTETIDGVDYDTCYLSDEIVMARIGTTDYTSLRAAIEAAEENDKIDLAADNHFFYTLTIPADKKITIDLNGYTIVTSTPITNKGDTTIIDSSTEKQMLDYHEANYFIVNDGGTLKLNNIRIKARFPLHNKTNSTLTLIDMTIDTNTGAETAIENYGTLNIQDSTIKSTYRSVYTSNGTLNVSNSHIESSQYAIYNSNSAATLNGTTLKTPYLENRDYYTYLQQSNAPSIIADNNNFYGRIRIESGTGTIDNSDISIDNTNWKRAIVYNGGNITINNSTLAKTEAETWGNENGMQVVQNAGTLAINESTINQTIIGKNYGNHSAIIENSGTLTLTDNICSQTVTNIENDTNNRTAYGIYNSGTLNYNNTSITLNRAITYGIYANSGTVNINSGTISGTSSDSAYGLWINTATVTMGEAESNSSANYGTANANVSITSPSISALGTNRGIGITLGAGSFNFYDGIITQSSVTSPAVQTDHTSAATITNVEYLYQPEMHTDANDNTYFILEYMR